MVSFSERMGIVAPGRVLAREAMPDSLRNLLWQACFVEIESEFHVRTDHGYSYKYRIHDLMVDLCIYVLKQSIDSLEKDSHYGNREFVKKYFYKSSWVQVYEFIEFVSSRVRDKEGLEKRINSFLELEKTAFRLKNGQLISVIEQIEIDEINKSLMIGDKFSGAREHIKKSVLQFSKKPDADYANSVKESISAIESACKIIVGDNNVTLGQALKKISEKISIHKSLVEGFSKLYGYSSDEGGIRHGMLGQSNVSEADARYMLVTCSAFLNYLAERDAVALAKP